MADSEVTWGGCYISLVTGLLIICASKFCMSDKILRYGRRIKGNLMGEGNK